MKTNDVRVFLECHGLKLVQNKRLSNDTGDQLLFETGEIVNIYDSGNIVPQGKNTVQIKQMLSEFSPRKHKIFIVYGHDSTARTQLEAMLLRWGLEPIILDQLPSDGQTIIEKLENYITQAHFAIVLSTPDDEGYPADKPHEKQFRARQNVVLELGMMLAKLGRERVVILLKNHANMEKPSDISGLIYISFNENVEDSKPLLYKELCSAGFYINPAKL